MKLYTREGHSFIELGIWKGTLPKMTVMFKTFYEGHPWGMEVYMREFSGKKVVRGELRYLKDKVLYRGR